MAIKNGCPYCPFCYSSLDLLKDGCAKDEDKDHKLSFLS